MAETKNSGYTNAVERSIDILEFMADRGRAVSVAEISGEFNVNRTSIYSILKVLMAKGYVRKVDEGRYALTGRMYEYGQKFRNSFPIVHIVRAVSASFSPAYPCTLNIAMYFSGDHAVLMNSINIEGPDSKRIDRTMSVGQSIPLHATSLGKILLAYMPPAASEDLLKTIRFESYTPFTVGTVEELKSQMHAAVTNGFATEENEYYYNTRCVAAPVFDSSNNVVAACSISRSTLDDSVDGCATVMDVKRLSSIISRALGAPRK